MGTGSDGVVGAMTPERDGTDGGVGVLVKPVSTANEREKEDVLEF